MKSDVSKSEEVMRGINRLLFWENSNLPISFDSFTQLNGIGKLKLKCLNEDAVKTVDPVIRVFLERLFCVQKPLHTGVLQYPQRMGGGSYYEFEFVLNQTFFDRSLVSGHHKKFIQFSDANGVTNKETLFAALTPLIHNLSKYIHTLKWKEKKFYRGIKHRFLALAYRNRMCESVSKMTSDKTDMLLEMVISGHRFHVPTRVQGFIAESEMVDLELLSTVYHKPTEVPSIDMEFVQHLDWIKHITDLRMYYVLGISLTQSWVNCFE